jgi:hypothetical protein
MEPLIPYLVSVHRLSHLHLHRACHCWKSLVAEAAAYCDYLATEAAYQGRLWGEVSGRRWRHSCMRVHATRHARYDRFCTRLEEVARKAVGEEEARARPIAIASEAGKFSSTLMHNRPVPTTRLRRELERCFRMVLDDEHRASSFQYGTATR